jgi:hypothetical protein
MTSFPQVHTLSSASAILYKNYNNLRNENLQLEQWKFGKEADHIQTHSFMVSMTTRKNVRCEALQISQNARTSTNSGMAHSQVIYRVQVYTKEWCNFKS